VRTDSKVEIKVDKNLFYEKKRHHRRFYIYCIHHILQKFEYLNDSEAGKSRIFSGEGHVTCLKAVSAPFVNLQWNIARAQSAVFCDSVLSAVFQVWCMRAIIFVHSDRHKDDVGRKIHRLYGINVQVKGNM
jgi:hypothetical protein